MINAVFGCKAVTRSSRPPLFTYSAPDVLATYLGWAIAEAERRNPGIVLEVVEAIDLGATQNTIDSQAELAADDLLFAETAPLYCTTDDEQEAHADIMGKLDA
jgi:hypothetical protein